MTAIWGKHGDGWRPLAPGQFEVEQTLHELIAEAPEMLPLAGSPELVVLGNEVRLGNGSADLIAVESSGRLVVIEVKLSRNAEAKRAVVAQALAYAAFLRGMEPAELEQRISQRAVSLADATAAFESRGEFDEAVFAEGLESCLANGFFRLVFVLDGTSPELERIVDYLEAVTHEGLLIDLVTVSAYDIGSERVMVPQRVEPGRAAVVARSQGRALAIRETKKATRTEGSTEFERILRDSPADEQEGAEDLVRWMKSLEQQGLARLLTTEGSWNTTLRPRFLNEDSGFVNLWRDPRRLTLTVEETVLRRRAPSLVDKVTSVARTVTTPSAAGSFTIRANDVPATILDLLTDAYREAAGVPIDAS